MAPKKQSETKVTETVEVPVKSKSASVKSDKVKDAVQPVVKVEEILVPSTKSSSTKKDSVKKEAVKKEEVTPKEVAVTEVTKKEKKSKVVADAVVATAVVATASVATPVVAVVGDEVVVEEDKKRKKVSKESLVEDFNLIAVKLDEEILKFEEKKKSDKNKVVGIQFLKQLRKLHKNLLRDSIKILKIKKLNRVVNENSGFKKPVRVSEDLCKFFSWDSSKLYSRTDVTRAVCKYIREFNLQDPTNKRIIKPDTKLTALLSYDPKTMPINVETNQPSPLYYYYLQKLLTQHFPDSLAKKL